MDDSSPRPARLPVIDVARGVALAAMILYHLSWDLAYNRFVAWDVAGDPLWRDFARAIAGSFLVISGVALALANRDGLHLDRHLWRIAKIAAAAAAVSLATYAIFPDAFVFFGILHMIAAGALILTPVLRAPALPLFVAAAAALALPSLWQSEAFDHPALWWTGLSPTVPASNDYVPVFPWIGPLLAGLALGRLIATGRIALPAVGAGGGPARLLARAGRWSLLVYLLHQPLLFGIVSGLAYLLPPDPAVERVRFVEECTAECSRWDQDGGDYCARFCGCVADALEGTSFWSVRGGDPDQQSLVATAATACRAGDDFDPEGPDSEPDLPDAPPNAAAPHPP